MVSQSETDADGISAAPSEYRLHDRQTHRRNINEKRIPMLEITTHSPAGTEAFAAEIGRRVRPGTAVALFGGMGAGKTAFTRGLCAGLGLPDLVSSPTFALVNEYHAAGCPSVYHFDMYRVTSPDALETTGFWDYPTDGSVFVIEWAENIPEALAELSCPILRVTLTGNGDQPRTIRIEGDECLADSRS